MTQATDDPSAGAPARYWTQTLRATAVLGAAWALATLGLPALAGLDVRVLGFPLGYWLMAQGSLLLYLAIVVAYVLWMERIERRARVRGEAGEGGER